MGVHVWGFLVYFQTHLTHSPQPILSPLPLGCLCRAPHEKNNEPATAENLPLAQPHKSNAWPKKRNFAMWKLHELENKKQKKKKNKGGRGNCHSCFYSGFCLWWWWWWNRGRSCQAKKSTQTKVLRLCISANIMHTGRCWQRGRGRGKSGSCHCKMQRRKQPDGDVGWLRTMPGHTKK